VNGHKKSAKLNRFPLLMVSGVTFVAKKRS